jgi:predicted methyltransferase
LLATVAANQRVCLVGRTIVRLLRDEHSTNQCAPENRILCSTPDRIGHHGRFDQTVDVQCSPADARVLWVCCKLRSEDGPSVNQSICYGVCALVIAAALNIPLAAQDDERDTAWLIEVLQLKPGSVVADIGAGPDALLTIPMARHVGPSGRVYATELGASVEKLKATVDKVGLQNIHVIAGAESASNLPSECCDAIVIRYVYHHFADPSAMNSNLRQSLTSGGVLAVIEFAPRGREAQTPAGRAAGDAHGVGVESIVRELESAGLELISSEQQDRTVRVVARNPR